MRRRLGALELEVMQIIWDRGEATVRQVWEVLYPTRKLAYTTVATVIRQIEEKEFLAHRKDGRTFVYRARAERSAVSRGMVSEMLDGLFRGSAADLVTTLIETQRVSPKEIGEIQRMIDAYAEGADDDD
jgi:BlaI family transcriptional regulator, penicillinase repressor